MTPNQRYRQNLVSEAAKELKIAKQNARLRARQEAKALFTERYDMYKQAAIAEYYAKLNISVERIVGKMLADMEPEEDDNLT